MTLETNTESGQALLIAIFIGLLLLITIPVVVFVNTTGVMHRVAATNRDKGTAIAEEGIGYANQMLSALTAGNPTAWTNALAGNFGVPFGTTECNSGANVAGPDGGLFRLACTSGAGCPTCQPYEVKVISTAYLLSPQGLKSTRAIQAYFSQKTVAATLPTGQTVAAALATMQSPVANGGSLEVFFGPIINYDATAWTLDQYSDTERIPRKLSVGSIIGTCKVGVGCPNATPTYPRSANPALPLSDQKEYWTQISPGFDPVINLAAYQAKAQNSSCSNPTQIGVANITPSTPGKCDFPSVGSGAGTGIEFDAAFTCATNPCVIYVNGNTTVATNMNFAPNMTLIVDGTGLNPVPTLILGNNGDGAVVQYAIARVPPTAALDDPYLSCGGVVPCDGSTTNKTDFQGFIYTNGNLEVAPTAATTWTIDGVVRVDGTTTLNPDATLRIYYNDIVNHNILTSSFQLMIDSQAEVTAQ